MVHVKTQTVKMIKEKNEHKVWDAAHLFCPSSRSGARVKLGGIRLPQHGFSSPRLEHMFWQLFPEPVIGVHVYRLSPTDTDVCTENNETTGPPIGVCAHCQDNHRWISEFLLLIQETFILEALNHDTDIPCFVQRRMLWFFAPTSLKNDLLNDGVILEHVMKQPTWLSKVPLLCTLEEMNTARACFMRSICAMLAGMTERVLEPRCRNEWLGFDGEDGEKDDDNGLEHL